MQTQHDNSLMNLARTWITLLLSFGLVLSFLPVSAFAASSEEAKSESYSIESELDNGENGQTPESDEVTGELPQDGLDGFADCYWDEEEDIQAGLEIVENAAVDDGSKYIEFLYIDEDRVAIGAEEVIVATFKQMLDATEYTLRYQKIGRASCRERA